MYQVVLKNIAIEDEVIVLSESSTLAIAQENRKSWRRILGGRNWVIDRRPGLDTLDHLGLTIRQAKA